MRNKNDLINRPISLYARSEVDSSRAITPVRYSKATFSLYPIFGTGLEVGCIGGEVAIFSDAPVRVKVGDSGQTIDFVESLRLSGKIAKLTFDIPATYLVPIVYGSLVIYQAFPSFGLGWQRDQWSEKPSRVLSWNQAAGWAGASNSFSSANFITNFTVLGQHRTPSEAYYLHGFYVTRSAGTIDLAVLQELESGGSDEIYAFGPEGTPSGRLIHRPPAPVRIATSTRLYLEGSTEAAATDVQCRAVYTAL